MASTLLIAAVAGCWAPRADRDHSQDPGHDPELIEDGPFDGPTDGQCPDADAVFPAHWNDGTRCSSEPAIQVHRYDENTFILRQSLCTSFEGPFMYLLFGDDKVLLEDTGAGGVPVANTVYSIIDAWLAEQGKNHIELIVVNSHAHGDHTAGNRQFTGEPDTTVVGANAANISAFFGLSGWPNGVASYDLGNRHIEIVALPGHEANHIAIYDHRTGMLLTGDTLYPGRLYIASFDAYVNSIARLVQLSELRSVCWVMGTHVEMTQTPGVDFAFGSQRHPHEHELQLRPAHLSELLQVVWNMRQAPAIETHDSFIVYPL